MMRFIVSLGLLIACAEFADGRVIEQGEIRTVALSGERAPGTPSGVVFGTEPSQGPQVFSPGVIDDAGRVAFRSLIAGPGIEPFDPAQLNNIGIWSEGRGPLSLVARAGDPAPGGGSFIGEIGLDLVTIQSGITAFRASAGGTEGVWSDRSGNLQEIAASFDFVMNDSGEIAFSSADAIWTDAFGPLMQTLVADARAPGLSDTAHFGQFSRPTALNAVGQVAFHSLLTSAHRRNQAIWTTGTDGTELIVRKGNAAAALGEMYFEFLHDDVRINDNGEVAFLAALSPTNIELDSVWRGTPDNLELVARSGQIAPGTNEPFTLFEDVLINGNGEVVFRGVLPGGTAGSPDKGIWSYRAGELRIVAREGQFIPGTRNRIFGLKGHSINSLGQIAFEAYIDSPGGTSEGIFVADTDGMLQSIVGGGDRIEVRPGEFRMVEFSTRFVTGSGNQDGHPSGFNERGQLAFLTRFTDGSEGIFVSNLVGVPEPHAAHLFVLVLFLSLAGRVWVAGHEQPT